MFLNGHSPGIDGAGAIKVTIPEPAISRDVDDTDVLGGPQYGPPVGLEVPET